MILSQYAKFLQLHNEDLITRKTTPLKLLPIWIKSVIEKNPKSHSDKIIHKEIMYAQNSEGDFIIVGKSDSGRVLVKALINFAKSYENYNHSRWLEMVETSYYKKDV